MGLFTLLPVLARFHKFHLCLFSHLSCIGYISPLLYSQPTPSCLTPPWASPPVPVLPPHPLPAQQGSLSGLGAQRELTAHRVYSVLRDKEARSLLKVTPDQVATHPHSCPHWGGPARARGSWLVIACPQKNLQEARQVTPGVPALWVTSLSQAQLTSNGSAVQVTSFICLLNNELPIAPEARGILHSGHPGEPSTPPSRPACSTVAS